MRLLASEAFTIDDDDDAHAGVSPASISASAPHFNVAGDAIFFRRPLVRGPGEKCFT